jgi:hypothetical protein
MTFSHEEWIEIGQEEALRKYVKWLDRRMMMFGQELSRVVTDVERGIHYAELIRCAALMDTAMTKASRMQHERIKRWRASGMWTDWAEVQSESEKACVEQVCDDHFSFLITQ